VSRLGEMLRMRFFPLSSESERFPRSDFTSVKSGALLPLDGRFPEVFTGFPLRVILAITFFSNLVNLFRRGNIKTGYRVQLIYDISKNNVGLQKEIIKLNINI
jgi:hypothetical protein